MAAVSPFLGSIFEYRVIFGDDRRKFLSILARYRHEAHEVLEAVAAAAFHLNTEGEVRVGVLLHNFREALRVVLAYHGLCSNSRRRPYLGGARRYFQYHVIALLVLHRVLHACRSLPRSSRRE